MQWSPRALETATAAVAGVALALAAARSEPVGRVLAGAAAAVVLGIAARDVLLRPRLRTGAGGVTVRTLTGSTTIPWPLAQVRVRLTRRLGVRAPTLELEDRSDDAVLLILGRRDLGAPPAAVAAALTAEARHATQRPARD